MKYIGLDIGTTSISGVVIEPSTQTLLGKKTIPNSHKIISDNPAVHMQDPEGIIQSVLKVLEELREICPDISGIGLTGQMHGILYTDKDGNAVSPLYTWQDEQGNLPYSREQTYTESLSEKTGYFLATGFGMVTHYVMSCQNRVPENAVSFCTIPDYLGMKLTGNTQPQLHPSMAQSLGCFHTEENYFDTGVLESVIPSLSVLPTVCKEECPIGYTHDKIPVYPALGDNQASFLGSVSQGDGLLVNVGTGSQISVLSSEYHQQDGMECRPYINKQYLLAYSPLCGGYSYALLHQFFEETARLLGIDPPADLYERMNQEAAGVCDDQLQVINHFLGTRSDPSCKGFIFGITPVNFTPAHLTRGILDGICQELYQCYCSLPPSLKTATHLTGSGNGLRKNPLLQKIFEETFQLPLHLSSYEEEAACGAAIFSSL